MNKIAKRLLSVFFVFLPVLTFAQTGARVTEQAGGFSYCLPLGWVLGEVPGYKYNFVFGPAEDDGNANINFADEAFDGNLRQYTDANITNLFVLLPEAKLLNRQEFRTNAGLTGERLSVNNTLFGRFLRQTFYIFPGPQNRYIVITCTVPENISAKYLPVFEESMKTFEWVR